MLNTFTLFMSLEKQKSMALISRNRKLSRNPIDDHRKTVGINEIEIIENLKMRLSRPLALAILITRKVAKVE